MKVPPQSFFNFCAQHVPLLRALVELSSEISEADARRLIRVTAVEDTELPETAWRRLRELQILVPTEPGSHFYFLAEPIGRLLAYLFDEAQATTPEVVRGYIQSLEGSGKQLARAIDGDNLTVVRLVMEEIHQTLRRIQANLDETHRSILAEVARYKTERQTVSVREKFRRIVHWMERYVEPMVEIVRADGLLRATFDETEQLLQRAREHGMFNDLPALERNTRYLRSVSRHALRVFQQCRRELQPLYESLRRSSFIGEGAAIALMRLERDGLEGWSKIHVITLCAMRLQDVPGDAAIERALRLVVEHPPEPAPTLVLETEQTQPEAYLRRVWLDSLPEQIGPDLPLTDFLGWIVNRFPQKDTSDILAGFTGVVFDSRFSARFTTAAPRVYETADGELEASPIKLTLA